MGNKQVINICERSFHNETIVGAELVYDGGDVQPESELLTIAYMSGQADEASRHRETKAALVALLHYIDHAGMWPSDDWNMERIREIGKGN